jgi:malonyl-CoA/methylmalonyl-CoA synthetase
MVNVALPALPMFKELVKHAQLGRTAIVDYSVAADGSAIYSYAQLLSDVAKFRDDLARELGVEDLKAARVAFLAENGYNYVVSLLTIWALGGFAVPLCTTHPIHEMLYTVTDSQATVILATRYFEQPMLELATLAANELSVKMSAHIVPQRSPSVVAAFPILVDSPIADSMRYALMLYTSGTTGKPKVPISSKI